MQNARLRTIVCLVACLLIFAGRIHADELRVGVATADITPGENFPMSGYYYERSATGLKDLLQAKVLVFRQETPAAVILCDLIGIWTDLGYAVREGVQKETGIPAANVMIAGTHTHTGPDYNRELYAVMTGQPIPTGTKPRQPYIPRLIESLVAAVKRADSETKPLILKSGTAKQEKTVSFNRRFLMQDGKVRTWMSLNSPGVVHAEGPIDPEVGMVLFEDPATQKPAAILSSFALHLDTVGGSEWSADYPFFMERTLQGALGNQVVSLFGNGCCGNINHVDPSKPERNSAEVIGTSLGKTILTAVPKLGEVKSPQLQIRRTTVPLPLRKPTAEQLAKSKQIIQLFQGGKTPEFYEHVEANRWLIVEHLRHNGTPDLHKLMMWGMSIQLAGKGDFLTVDVQVITLGRDVAIVALPGEVFVELGLAIKNASPFKTTLVVELSNNLETLYVPTRYAYVGGGYEPTNSTLEPGSGELLAEAAIKLLSECAAGVTQK
ncbi:MAG: hypothetical protein U0903_20405 [Planctomycetales bacterium]